MTFYLCIEPICVWCRFFFRPNFNNGLIYISFYIGKLFSVYYLRERRNVISINCYN